MSCHLEGHACCDALDDCRTALAASQERVRVLTEALRELRDASEYPADEIGVHPEKWIGEGGYEKRTPEMEEHNAKVTRFIQALVLASAALSPAPSAPKPAEQEKNP